MVNDHCPSYDELKEIHHENMQHALKVFKQKAMGDESIEEHENKICAQIRQEYGLIKKKCFQEYKKEIDRLIKDEIDSFSFDIKTGKFANDQELMAKMDLLKAILNQKVSKIDFKEKDQIINQACTDLTSLGYKNLL